MRSLQAFLLCLAGYLTTSTQCRPVTRFFRLLSRMLCRDPHDLFSNRVIGFRWIRAACTPTTLPRSSLGFGQVVPSVSGSILSFDLQFGYQRSMPPGRTFAPSEVLKIESSFLLSSHASIVRYLGSDSSSHRNRRYTSPRTHHTCFLAKTYRQFWFWP